MARSIRTLPLLIALGAVLTVASPAMAANGGAAPVAVPSGAGGATPAAAPAGSAGGGGAGGAAPGVTPNGRERSASSAQTGGALAGRRPARKIVARRTPSKRARRPARPRAPAEPPPPPPSRGATPPADDGSDVSTVAGRFPVSGPYTFGGSGSRFGASRPGHVHQGQDVAAALGTPIVAPVAATVSWKSNQPGGAGIYLVLHSDADGRDYVFMHLKPGSVRVAPGDAVTAGQQIAEVGSTGESSGPHLHFEIWIGGWQAAGGRPIDPLPQLQRWAG